MTAPFSLAARVTGLKPSATMEMTERIRVARAAGRRILGLSSGDPNIETDPRIVAAAERALRDGETHYGPPAGIAALREAIAARETEVTGTGIDPDDVLITPGGKFAILAALMATVEPGDEVLIPDPGWVSYGPCVRLCGGTPVTFDCLNGYDAAALDAASGPRTRAIIVNSPANPSAHAMSRAECEAVLEIAKKSNLVIIFDQVYADLAYGDRVARLHALPGARERTFVADSLSKTFGMTGWRIGSLLTPPGTAKPVLKFLQHSLYCTPPFIQRAAVAALTIADEIVPAYRDTFRRRIDTAVPRLNAIPGIRCARPDATFYLFPEIDADEREVARFWLDEGDVAVLPGSAFGDAGRRRLRLSLACPDAELDEALGRIETLGLAAHETS